MKRLMRAPATAGKTGGRQTPSATLKTDISPAFANKTIYRLCWITLFFALTTVSMFLFQFLFQPEVAKLQRQPAYLSVWISLFLLNVVFAVLQWRGVLPIRYVLYAATAYEILVSLGVSLLETAVPFDVASPVRGISTVAHWIVICGLLVPNTPTMTLISSLGSALMWPLGYYLNLLIYKNPPLPGNRLTMWIYPVVVSAIWAYLLNRRIYRMEIEMERAKDLGSYKLEQIIGKGGMGEVWRARHRLLAREAAVKLIRPEVLASQTGRNAALVRRRFEQEAKATAALRSPHTVSLFDFGPAEDGSFYYAMELLDGIDLETLVRRYGPQPAARVAHIIAQICDSLEEAHRNAMVHRDIKPTNLFVCRVGTRYDFVKVLDFGLVKASNDDGQSRMTKDGMTTGTPAYMAPEIALGKESIDGRADIYGLGCVAYYLLTGRLVFDEPTATAQALAHVQKEPVPPSEWTEIPIPRSFEQIVMRCLAKDPADRPRSAQALADAIEALDDVGQWTREDAVSWWQLHHPTEQPPLPAEEPEQEEISVSSVVYPAR